MGRIFRTTSASPCRLGALGPLLLCLLALTGPAPATAALPAADEPLIYLDQSAPSPPALYESLARDRHAALVTTDSAIWALTLVHDRTLSAAETRFLAPRLASILERLDRALAPAEKTPATLLLDGTAQALPASLTEPARRAHRFVQVARALLDGGERPAGSGPASGNATNPSLSDALARELDRIAHHTEAAANSDVLDQSVDYRLFAPTGRATAAPDLARYQAATTWLGQMVFRLDERTPAVGPLDVPPPTVASGWFTGLDPQAAAAGDRDAMAHLAIAYPQRGLDEMRAAAILCLLLERLKSDAWGRTCLDEWREIDAFLKVWYGPAPDLDAPTLLDSLHQRMKDKSSLDSDLQFLANNDQARRWIAWLEPRLHCGSDPDLVRRRRGFALLGLRPQADLRILQTVTASPEWHGALTPPPLSASALGVVSALSFTRVDPLNGGRPERGVPRGYDLLRAMGSAPARRLLERDRDTAYSGFDARAFDAGLLWRSYTGDKTHTWWEFASTEPTTPSVRKSLLLTVQLAALPARPQADAWPNYVRQDLHELQRLNTGLATWALLRRDRPAPTNGAAPPRSNASQAAAAAAAEPAPPREHPDATSPHGYVDPFPDVFDHLARTADQMRQALRLTHGVPGAFAGEAEALATLCDRLAAISRREIDVPNQDLSARDYGLIADWGGALRHALALPRDTPEARWFATDSPVAGLSTIAGAQGQCLQVAVAPMRTLRTVAPVTPDANAEVCGAVLPYCEWHCAWDQRLGDAAWAAEPVPLTSEPNASEDDHTPWVLREIRESASSGRKTEQLPPAPRPRDRDPGTSLALPPPATH